MAVVLIFVFVGPLPAYATGGEGEAWPAFTESSSCGARRVSTPHAQETGWLSRDTLLRGEFAGLFGRSVAQVQEALVPWQLPGSNNTLDVHPLLLPALEQAATQIEATIDSGDRYPIDGTTTYSAAARTISGSLRMSRHTFGTAFDVNSRRNPFRADNVLVTDLPDGWVQPFLDAGFCWGGLWIGSKDAMHFAWQGPRFSGMTSLPAPYEPLTDPARFTGPAASIRVLPRANRDTLVTVLADADGNGAVDVIRIKVLGSDLLVDASLASRRHNACSSRVSVVSGIGDLARRSLAMGFGDLDGRGGQDLWIATDENGLIRLMVRRAFGEFAAETSTVTNVPTPTGRPWISTADFDVNGAIDLFVVEDDTVTVWAINPDNGSTSVLFTGPNPSTGASEYFLGDFDLDNRPDLWAIQEGTVTVALAADDYRSATSVARPEGLPNSLVDIRAADYDGDGRADLIAFDGITKMVWLGNTRLDDGLPLEVWFEYEDPACEDGERTWDRQELRFATSTWIAQGAYTWRTRNGLSVGCDPSDDTCEAGLVTRQMFAEFLAWIDDLDAVSGRSDRSAAWALVRAGNEIPCETRDDECWNGAMSPAEVSGLFGRFLTDRRGDVPAPHRWVIPGEPPGPAPLLPR
ncbi:MAG: hypothetical protein BMS9Abin12_1166 [Acidimicrobiia bacterium]|nr:MAG: hypothetical protein BMS9Abin12_1166 [Acidimicrobiia bacterium]